VLASVVARTAERREHEAKAQAAHATRVGAMGAFVASLAHELTQPLAASLANAETGVRLLAAEPDLDCVRRSRISSPTSARRGPSEAALPHRGRWSAARSPARLSRKCCSSSPGRSARRDDPLGRTPEGAAGGRRRPVSSAVVLNLLSNAIDAVAAGDRPAREVAVLAGRCGDGVSVEVRDSGAGMDTETLARIFQPFFTTKPKGMGLGLSISRTIVGRGERSAHRAEGSDRLPGRPGTR
jgi:signal transduction histidine kinase